MSLDNIIQLHAKNENMILDVEQIQELIPHRAPILMVEKLTNIVLGESAVGIKSVSVNEPFFQGHFPKVKVMPGVLIIEAMAQTASALMTYSLNMKQDDLLVYFISIDNARFRKPVVPGDKLELHVKKVQARGNVWKFSGKAYVDGVLHAEATYAAMVVDNKKK
jgi:3-hydroxyacyl-[acyl-carrier-protein] dehydratase